MATVEIEDPQPRLVLPVTAVGSAAGQDHVWAIEKGVLMRRAVTLGRRDDAGARVEVLAGIGPDAQVLALRFDNLREGLRANIVAADPAVASPASASAQTLR